MKYTPRPVAEPAKASVKANTVKPKGTAHLKPPGEVRIIGGIYKRSKLAVPDKPGLRPTPDRVRETLFNWLGQDLTGWRCADVFAGTGALGFEAASRGAAEVLLCEQDPALVLQLKAVQARLKAEAVRIERGDGFGRVLHEAAPRTMVTIFSGWSLRAKAARMSATVTFSTCRVQVSR